MNTGIYTIKNLINNKIYVGSTIRSFKIRKSLHFSNLNLNRHHCKHLQAAWNKYGKDNFVFEILEECEPEFCISMEQYWMNMLNVCNRKYGYNSTPVAGSRLGCKLSEETKRKIGNSRRGKSTGKGKIVLDITKVKLSNIVKEWHKNNKEKFLLGRRKIFKSVVRINIKTNEIVEYESLTQAAKINNMSKQVLKYRVDGLKKEIEDFIWKYKE